MIIGPIVTDASIHILTCVWVFNGFSNAMLWSVGSKFWSDWIFSNYIWSLEVLENLKLKSIKQLQEIQP